MLMVYFGISAAVFLIFRFFVFDMYGDHSFSRSVSAETGAPLWLSSKTAVSLFLAIVWPLLLGLILYSGLRKC